jgi:cytochrome c biogenesis protein CcdA/thiol-disulfide isomerase/thioredoxin
MAILIVFAFASGVITILSPCILPLLPVILSSSAAGGKARPFGVIAGFFASFAVFTLTLSAIVQALRVPVDALRVAAVILISLLGLVMVVPKLSTGFELLASRLAGLRIGRAPPSGAPSGAPASNVLGSGFWGGSLTGLGLGIVWTPCVGPIMASVISLALTRRVDGGSVSITLAYTLGTAIPMLAVMLGGRALFTRVPGLLKNTAAIRKGFGVLMILVAAAVGFGLDLRFQSVILRALPKYGAGLTAIEDTAPVRDALEARAPSSGGGGGTSMMMTAPTERAVEGVFGEYGPVPPFITAGRWFNTEGVVGAAGDVPDGGSPPLTMRGLLGRVVLIDFWTYSCVNCVRTIPYLRAWYAAYGDEGFVIVGVHTPEFEFEKNPENVARAIRELGVDWPVVQDNDYAQWYAYSNRYWPAHYFVDAKGTLRYVHFGEGNYDVSEGVIRRLLREAGASLEEEVSKPAPALASRTPETYLGYERAEGFVTTLSPVHDGVGDYLPTGTPGNGEWSLTGKWTITGQYVVPQASGALELGFDAKNVFLVIEPEQKGGTVEVRVDGQPPADTEDVKNGELSPTESRLYHLVALKKPGPHALRLEVRGRLRLFAFTFG